MSDRSYKRTADKDLHTTDHSKLDIRRGRILLARGNRARPIGRVLIGFLKLERGPDWILKASQFTGYGAKNTVM